MRQISRNKSQYKGLKKIYYSTKYSIQGLVYAYGNERSLWLHAGLSAITIAMGFVLRISRIQWSMILIALGVVLAIELLNTAIEAVVDMVTLEYNELAKIAKDCGSAATFTTTVIAAIIVGVIFIPKIILLLGI